MAIEGVKSYQVDQIATKTLNRGKSSFIVMDTDTQPLEIILHIPLVCEDKNTLFVLVPSKVAFRRACGVARAAIACSVAGENDSQLTEAVRKMQIDIEKLRIGCCLFKQVLPMSSFFRLFWQFLWGFGR